MPRSPSGQHEALDVPELVGTEPGRTIERHVQSIMLALIMALLGWAGLKIQSVGDTNIRLEERVTALQAEVVALKAQLAAASGERYSTRDAEREFGRVNIDLRELRGRVEQLERRR